MDSDSLARELLQALIAVRFHEVIDFGPYEDACPGAPFCIYPAPPIAHLPNVDVALLALDEVGQVRAAANVLLSRDYPQGLIVPLDENYTASSVNFLRWDIERWNGGFFADRQQHSIKGWADNPPLTAADAIIAGREDAPFRFMSPYPASGFKLLIAFWLMRLLDANLLQLEQAVSYESETRSLHAWLDPMITESDNRATYALIKLLWDLDQMNALNTDLADLGLATLQINGTDPLTGTRWQPGQIHMTAMDTARLLWLINGTDGILWQQPDGKPVEAAILSGKSRAYLKRLLAEQGLHEALSTGNYGDAPNVQPGIPARVPSRWINPQDGTVTAANVIYGRDIRATNARAEVEFLHKTGLTYNYASDMGIVKSLPGQPFRHYVVAFFANLGYRYADPIFAERTSLPYYDPVTPICYTQKIAAFGKKIDNIMKEIY